MHIAMNDEVFEQGANEGVVLGHCVNHGDEIINMQDEGSFQKLANILRHYGFPFTPTLMSNGQEWTIEDEVRGVFYNHPNCGDDEDGYEAALVHPNPRIRALVAANGKHLKELANDKDVLVRQQVTNYLTKELDKGDTEDLSVEHKEVLAIVLRAELKNMQAMSSMI